jgi:threonine dehydratase
MVTLSDVQAAAERIAPFVRRTPVMTSRYYDERFGAHFFFKCESLQRTGSFKARGAVNAVMQLTDEQARHGVATHSSGNHAQALAWAASLRGLPCTIVMPRTTPDVKRAAVRGYGAEIVECEPTLQSRLDTLRTVVDRTQAHVVPPFDDVRIIAGQGTAALELLQDVPDLDLVIAPVGGGGLMSGTAVAAKALRPNIEIYGAEPEIADDARRSLETGIVQPPPTSMTIADGLRTSLTQTTFEHLRNLGVRIITAPEDGIMHELRAVLERMKIVVEPSATVTIAALARTPRLVHARRVGVILCGGNVDLSLLSTL